MEHKFHSRKGHTERSSTAEHVPSMEHRMYCEPSVPAEESNHTERTVGEELAIYKLETRKTMNHDCELEPSKLWVDVLKL